MWTLPVLITSVCGHSLRAGSNASLCQQRSRRVLFPFMFLLLFILSQSILEKHHGEYNVNAIGVTIFVYRPLIYACSLMVQLVYVHGTKCLSAFKAGNYVKFMSVVHVPNYLFSWQDSAGFVRILSLVSMLIFVPILWCMRETDDNFQHDLRRGF